MARALVDAVRDVIERVCMTRHASAPNARACAVRDARARWIKFLDSGQKIVFDKKII
jgi:hypothetical protein